MKTIFTTLMILISCSFTFSQATVIVNHTCTDVSQIPDEYINKVKGMLLNYLGESHARGVLYGFQLLAAEDSRYSVDVNFEGQTPSGNNTLRVSRTYWDGNSWDEICGEQHFWTNEAGKTMLKNYLDFMQNTQSDAVSALGFGWCWDMTWHNVPGGTIDPVYNVRWAGASEGGPDGDMRWGIDADDTQLTGNSLSLQDYLQAVDGYNAHNSNTITFFTTGPVDKYNGESGYQRYLKHEAIRAYVTENGGYLFDYADILNWQDGVEYTTTWNGITYPIGNPDLATGGEGYNGGFGGCHISDAACLKLAKGMWWLLARMAGWDGNNSTTSANDLKIRTAEIEVFPNPGNGLFNIASPLLKSIEVYDSKGNLILKEAVKTNKLDIDLTNYSSGFYYLKAKIGEEIIEKKLVKVK